MSILTCIKETITKLFNSSISSRNLSNYTANSKFKRKATSITRSVTFSVNVENGNYLSRLIELQQHGNEVINVMMWNIFLFCIRLRLGSLDFTMFCKIFCIEEYKIWNYECGSLVSGKHKHLAQTSCQLKLSQK